MCGFLFLGKLVVVEEFKCIVTGLGVAWAAVGEGIADCAWARKNLGDPQNSKLCYGQNEHVHRSS